MHFKIETKIALITRVICIFICFISPEASAQFSFERMPEDLAFFPRNANNKCEIRVSGQFMDSGYEQILSRIVSMENDSVIEEKTIRKGFNGMFSYKHEIVAALREYKLQVLANGIQGEVLVREVNHLVCGDVFLIAGQSNALDAKEARTNTDLVPSDSTLNQGAQHNKLYSHPYCRSIGYAMNYWNDVKSRPGDSARALNDYSWGRPGCLYWDVGFVGAWALQLQHALAEATGIPICFVNGAYSGAEITRLQASQMHLSKTGEDLKKPYDRAYSKLMAKGLTEHVKGIFWYQGEADGALEYDAAKRYTDHFEKLYQTWKVDYPNFKQVFLFQANTACGGKNLSLIRALQSEIAEGHPDIEIMSTVGSSAEERNQKDACHNSILGSSRMAEKMTPLVLNGVYGFSHSKNEFFPPRAKRASYKISGSQICIEFDQNIYLQPPRTLSYSASNSQIVWVEEKLEHYFYDEYGSRLEVLELRSKENELVITLSPGVCRPKKISYLPSTYYDETHYPGASAPVYAGPWIMNQANTIGALSFHDVTLDCENTGEGEMCCNTIKVFPNPSTGELIVLSADEREKELKVCNTNGKEVFRIRFNEERQFIDLSGLPKGLYLFQVFSENEPVDQIKIVLEE